MNEKRTLWFAAIGLSLSILANAQSASFTGEILVGDQPAAPGSYDSFGDHIDANDDWLMVSAPREDIDFDNDGISRAQGDQDVGAVYIYRRTANGPVFHSKIEGEGNNVNPNTRGDVFGAGIVLHGNTMFVGAANDDDFPGLVDPTGGNFRFAGKVYVFTYDVASDEWKLVQKMKSDSPNTFGSFGARTDSSHMELFSFGNGETEPTIALIGERQGNQPDIAAKLHVFKRKKNTTQWERVQIASAPSGTTFARFAGKVEGVGKYALVTESEINAYPEPSPSAVHVYRIGPNGIIETNGQLAPVQTLFRPGESVDPLDCDVEFGQGLSAANGIAAIGDPCDDTVGTNAGAVHVYTVDNSGNNVPLTLSQTLPNPSAIAGSFFGTNFANGKQSISTDGNVIVVGTANFRGPGPFQINAELFARDANGTFVPTDSIPSPIPGVLGEEEYGQAVHLLGDDELAISQGSNGDLNIVSGLVFLFEIL